MDINLFEEINYKKKDGSNIIILALFSILIIGLSILVIKNQITISRLNNDINNRIEILQNPISQEKINELKQFKNELDNKQQEYDRLNSLNRVIGETDILTFQTLEDIDSSTIDGIILSDISFSENTLELNGVGVNPNKIAEYSSVLGKFDSICHVNISHINQNNNYYNFLINLSLKGEAIEVTN